MALLLRGDDGLLEAAGLLELSFALVSPALLPPQAAVMVSADAIAPAAASLFIVGMVFPFHLSIVCSSCWWFALGEDMDGWSRCGISGQTTLTFTLCQPVDPLGAIGARAEVWV